MAAKTGLGTQFGIAAQVDQTTRITPTRFFEVTSWGLALDATYASSQGLRAGRKVTRHSRHYRRGVAGPVSMEHPIVGAGLLWKHILGDAATTTPGGTDPRDHTCTIGELDGDFLTGQVSVPQEDGTAPSVRDFVGLKITGASLTQSGPESFLQIQPTFDGYDVEDNNSLATASYSTDYDVFHGADCVVQVAGSNFLADEFALNIDNGLAVDRRKLRGDTRKLEQIENTSVDGRNITGSIPSDFASDTVEDYYNDGTEFSVSATWTSPTEIESGYPFSLTITLPRCRADSGAATVGGPGVVTQPLGFKVLEPTNGDEPITVVVRDNLTAP